MGIIGYEIVSRFTHPTQDGKYHLCNNAGEISIHEKINFFVKFNCWDHRSVPFPAINTESCSHWLRPIINEFPGPKWRSVSELGLPNDWQNKMIRLIGTKKAINPDRYIVGINCLIRCYGSQYETLFENKNIPFDNLEYLEE